jgi:putative nucleotidyltransferase with HDIG domain
MRFSDNVAQGILDLDEHWNGGGHPLGLAGSAISLNARLALMAQVVDVFFVTAGPRAAVNEARRRRGAWFDPHLVDAFEVVAGDPGFWDALNAPDLERRVLDLEPAAEIAEVDEDYLDDIAAAFAKVIDAKSPYTSGHSDRVALFADLIAEQMGIDEARRRWLQRAALLHDVGKLGVSNQILDKPGKLDADEWTQMQRHTVLGEQILSRISAFADLARIAGAHHEKLDGTGYPRGWAAAELDLETRIVTTADIFDALTADRPYRSAMPVSEAFRIMTGMLGTAIDRDCFAALQSAVARVDQTAAA